MPVRRRTQAKVLARRVEALTASLTLYLRGSLNRAVDSFWYIGHQFSFRSVKVVPHFYGTLKF